MKLVRAWQNRPFTKLDALVAVVLMLLIGTALANGSLQTAGPLVTTLVVAGNLALLAIGLKYFGYLGKKTK